MLNFSQNIYICAPISINSVDYSAKLAGHITETGNKTEPEKRKTSGTGQEKRKRTRTQTGTGMGTEKEQWSKL